MGFLKHSVPLLVFTILFVLIEYTKSVDSAKDCTGEHANTISSNPDNIGFYFYPLRGIPQREQKIEFNNTESLNNSAFNKTAEKTVILIHGFTDNRTIHMPPVVLQAYLASKLNYNYIVVDWGLLSGNCYLPDILSNYPLMLKIYTSVVFESIPIVVSRTTDFINFLNIDPRKVHIIGHSLGAHTSGDIGALYQSQHSGTKFARITGLDPAGPLFMPTILSTDRTIDKTDASFVDIIHTNMGANGEIALDGHVDFFPNGGAIQPGCETLNLDVLGPIGAFVNSSSCDHQFAPILYAASLKKKFPVNCICLGLSLLFLLPSEFVDQVRLCLLNCPLIQTGNPPTVYMGINCPTTAQGAYVLRTTNPP